MKDVQCYEPFGGIALRNHFHCYYYIRTKYQDLENHIKGNKRIAALSARNITPLTKRLKCAESSAV